MSASRLFTVRPVFYVLAVAFHAFLLFTNLGNFYHGGTAIELIAIEAIAVLMVFCAVKLFLKIRLKEKILVCLLVAIPAVSIVWAMMSGLTNYFQFNI